MEKAPALDTMPLYILSNCPAFRGTVPIFCSKFTAVPLFLHFVPLFLRATVNGGNGGNGKWKRKVETESGNGTRKRKRKAE